MSVEPYMFVCALLLLAHFSALNVQPLVTFWGLSYRSCLKECQCSAEFHVVEYERRYTRCTLHVGRATLSPHRIPGRKLSFVSSMPVKNDTCIPSPDGDKCSEGFCRRPPAILGAVLEGNMVTVGSKAQHKCPGRFVKFPITCLSYGEWSDTDLLRCNCSIPKGNHHATIAYKQKSKHVIEMILSCDIDYELITVGNNPKCNLQTGKWTGRHLSGCYIMSKPPFRKIYSYVSGDIMKSWKNEQYYTNDMRPNGQFRNSSVFNNWEIYVNKRIRLEIIKDENVVNFVIFNGAERNMLSWFSSDTIVESSWNDLNSKTANALATVDGYNKIRFLVIQSLDGENRCNHTGWFVVAWKYYPCEEQKRLNTLIVYSKKNTVARFRNSDVGIADRFEVWIEE